MNRGNCCCIKFNNSPHQSIRTLSTIIFSSLRQSRHDDIRIWVVVILQRFSSLHQTSTNTVSKFSRSISSERSNKNLRNRKVFVEGKFSDNESSHGIRLASTGTRFNKESVFQRLISEDKYITHTNTYLDFAFSPGNDGIGVKPSSLYFLLSYLGISEK